MKNIFILIPLLVLTYACNATIKEETNDSGKRLRIAMRLVDTTASNEVLIQTKDALKKYLEENKIKNFTCEVEGNRIVLLAPEETNKKIVYHFLSHVGNISMEPLADIKILGAGFQKWEKLYPDDTSTIRLLSLRYSDYSEFETKSENLFTLDNFLNSAKAKNIFPSINFLKANKPSFVRKNASLTSIYPIETSPLAIKGDIFKVLKIDSSDNYVKLNIELKDQFIKKFEQLTKTVKGIAIIYDGLVIYAPMVRMPIADGKMFISGNFSNEEIKELRWMLSSRPVNTALKITEEQIIDIKKK